ncbi:MAG TPA: Hsp20/alpha crystallin family protein [Thermoanaerobaculia bacterium]|jgi:HSP20 family protein|nr:Hsp20/alpha crystallin family protein [Thermoanaerobaculia bacterium]
MTRIVRFNPFGDLRRLEATLFEPFFRYPFVPEEARSSTWNPPVDVLEENDKIFVKVEAPGVDEKDFHVTFEDGLLTITGERQFERRDDRNYHRIERSYGTFTRSFTLPSSIDANQIKADYRNGVLEIEIPKKEESRPKQIQVNVNAAISEQAAAV